MKSISGNHVKIPDLITGIVIIIIGIYVYIATASMPVISENTLGSAFWPRIVATLFSILGAVLIVSSLIGTVTTSYFHLEAGKKKNASDLGVMMGVLVLYGLVWNRLPFIATTPVFIMIAGMVMRMSKKNAIILAILLTGLLYVVFRLGLSVMLK
jgi:hypothetical protein